MADTSRQFAEQNGFPAMSEDLNFSRPLDVHRWSDFPEANKIVDKVYADAFGAGKATIERKHLKVVVLDLYVAWLLDPNYKIAVHKSPNAYSLHKRYNALRITKKTIDVVNVLNATGYIHEATGFLDRQSKTGRLTRIWAAEKLVDLFRGSELSPRMVGRSADEEVIILKNMDGDEIDYADTPETDSMRALVRAYNSLLAVSLIDIRRLNEPWIVKSDGSKMPIGAHSQRVRRVFNRGSFDKGGRFFGAWWQGCPKELRKEIFINDAPTIEQDYSSLHIALLYAREGLNYYQSDIGDAYQLDVPTFLQSKGQTRKYAKLLLLMAVNAKTDNAAYAAFRENRKEGHDGVGASLKNEQLKTLLDGLKTKHPAIAEYLGSDAGIDLMHQDSQITENVIRVFTEKGIPVLTVHDSYIVNFAYWGLLEDTLNDAYSKLTGMEGIKSERMGVALGDEESWMNQRLPQEAMIRSSGYKQRLLDWMSSSRG